ncbi:MAG TPA: hypothetical protein VHY37_02485 [Tepidisphaeraceae bacterium]|nr:hypothetical protein [Tepidisphaeraceae bacterium]
MERSRSAGFPTQKKLAMAVGCRYEQLSRWLNMETPPAMRKGFDTLLAHALKTSTRVLLMDYVNVPPEGATHAAAFDVPAFRWLAWGPELSTADRLKTLIPLAHKEDLDWVLTALVRLMLYRRDAEMTGRPVPRHPWPGSKTPAVVLTSIDQIRELSERTRGKKMSAKQYNAIVDEIMARIPAETGIPQINKPKR